MGVVRAQNGTTQQEWRSPEEVTFELKHKKGKRVIQVEETELARPKIRWKGDLNRVNLGND